MLNFAWLGATYATCKTTTLPNTLVTSSDGDTTSRVETAFPLLDVVPPPLNAFYHGFK